MGRAQPERGWSVERPGLEYQHAFDLCAVEVHRRGGPVVVSASSPFYVRELVKRMAGCGGVLVASGGWAAPGANLDLLLGPEPGGAGFGLAGEADELVPARAAVWAEPEGGDGERRLAEIGKSLAPGGRLCVIVSGWLRWGLPEWQGEEGRPAAQPVGLGGAVAWLRRTGFAVEGVVGFHGPQSLVWGFASRLPAAVGRADLVDRCYAAMRKTYVVRGWQARWAPVAVVLARKRTAGG
jgi:hypothetical protein